MLVSRVRVIDDSTGTELVALADRLPPGRGRAGAEAEQSQTEKGASPHANVPMKSARIR